MLSNTMSSQASDFNLLDIGAVGVYFALVLVVAFICMFRANRSTVSGYFLAGRSMTWLPVGASLFASNIGSEHFIGLAGAGAATGLGVGAFETNALIFLQLLGWVFVPVYIASSVHTLPQFMQKRFGGTRIRTYLVCVSLALYIFTKISVNLYSGGLFVQVAMGWDIYASILLVLTVTAICTITGGLAAVIYTDTLQCFLMITGGSALAVLSFVRVGGLGGLRSGYAGVLERSNSSCSVRPEEAFRMLRSADDPNFPWLGFLLGQSTAAIWYWSADQMMVQRTLSAKSLTHAQGATIFAAYLKLFPLFIIVVPGMISRVLFPEVIGCETDCLERCGNPVSCSNIAYPWLVVNLLPPGWLVGHNAHDLASTRPGARGVMFAVMMAALMSDLTSIFNSASTLFTIDIYHRIRRAAKPRELLIAGRLFVLVMVFISVLWIPVVTTQQDGQLFIYIQAVSAAISPPVGAVFLLAILWKRFNEPGAFWALMVGLALAVSRLTVKFVFAKPPCDQPDNRLLLARLHYLYFAFISFAITVTVAVTIALFTKPPEAHMLFRTTFWTRKVRQPDNETAGEGVEMGKREETPTSLDSPDRADEAFDADVEATTPPSSVRLRRQTLYDFCCGDSPSNMTRKTAHETHLQQLSSIEQSRKARIFMTLNLAIVLGAAMFIFIFFSVFT